MRFEITWDEPDAERKLKRELNSFFSEEEKELYELATPYFLILTREGIVCTFDGSYTGHYTIGDEKVPADKMEPFIQKKIIGKSNRVLEGLSPSMIFLFDDFDANFNNAKKHPMGIEVYYELKCEAKHPEKHIPILLKEVLAKYDKLHKVLKKGTPRSKILATAIALTCRGEYQCPVNMNKYFRMAGGPLAVQEAGEKISVDMRYDPDARVRAYIPKLGLKGDSLQKFMELWKKERGRAAVTPAYIGGLAWAAGQLSGQSTTQKDIADMVDASEVAIRNNAKKIFIRQGIKTPGKLSRDETRKISEEFQKKLGLPETFEVSRYTSSPLLKARLQIAEHLIKNKHDEKNPISMGELINKLNLSYEEFQTAIGSKDWWRPEWFFPYISPVNIGVHYDRELYVEDVAKVRKYIGLMKKLLNMFKD